MSFLRTKIEKLKNRLDDLRPPPPSLIKFCNTDADIKNAEREFLTAEKGKYLTVVCITMKDARKTKKGA